MIPLGPGEVIYGSCIIKLKISLEEQKIKDGISFRETSVTLSVDRERTEELKH